MWDENITVLHGQFAKTFLAKKTEFTSKVIQIYQKFAVKIINGYFNHVHLFIRNKLFADNSVWSFFEADPWLVLPLLTLISQD